MILFRILNIRKTIKDTQDIARDPAGFIGGEIKKTVLVSSIFSGIILLAILVFLYILGFTDILISPSGLARFFFYIGVIVVFFGFAWSFIFLYFLKKIKDKFQSFSSDTTIQVDKDVVVEDDNHMIS